MIPLKNLLLLCFITVSLNYQKLTTYQIPEFEPSDNDVLYHVTVHNTTGDIYIGAHNALYRLSANLTIISTTSTCLPADEDCDNINGVLAIDYDRNRLITCGGGNNGRCEARFLMDLSLDGSNFLEGIFGAVGLIAPGLIDFKVENVLYVSSSHTSSDGVNFPMYINARTYYQKTLGFAQIVDGVQPSSHFKTSNRIINFKAAFSFKEYTYFAAFRQSAGFDGFDENIFFSRLSRVCHGSSFDTLSEVVLRCVSGDIDYNLVQSMSVGPVGSNLAASLDILEGDNVLYGVFSKDDCTGSGNPTEHSALCVYKLNDIEDAFFKALNVCLTGSDMARALQRLAYADAASCSEHMLSLSAADVMFLMCPADFRDPLRHYSQGLYTQAAVSQAVLTVTDTILTSVIATVEENHTIAFLGTDDGQLMKVNIVSNSSAKVYENITLDAGQEVRSDTFLDKSSNQLMVLTESKLLKLVVADCSQFSTCDECVRPTGHQDGDPYCGWCALEKICTRFNDCKSSSWLPSNTAQCIQIKEVEPPFLHYTNENIKVKLTVEQLPPLNNNQVYNCKFDNFVSIGMKKGETVTCTSPPRAQLPQIPTGDAAVEVSLSVHSSQTDVDFVTTHFTFFDCSAITSCSECVTRFTCGWCLYGNTCIYNASALCSADDQVIFNDNATVTPPPGGMQGHGSCPQIVRQINEELIHASLEKEVRIPVKNLPYASNVNGYKCVLTIEGEKSSIPASVQESNITCSEHTYDYAADEQELTANIQIVWNDNNFIDNIYEVTLYKCSVQRPDCSRCLSNYTTRPQLDCVWCGGQCLYSFCPTEKSDCPAPVITQVIPLSVATVINQPEPDYTEVIELVGTDFGQTSSDIDSIMIGSKECEKIADGFDIASQTVKCRAPVFSTASQRNVIISVQGISSGQEKNIVYQNPSISDISPKFGIKHGGTRVNITGLLLNTGQDLMVSMGESECYIKSVSENQILCTTSHYAVKEEVMVTVTFGQATRGASTFTYTDNPSVEDFNPKSSIKAGGRKINVTGVNFQYVQEAKMLVNGVSAEKNCDVLSNEMMSCESPPIELSSSGQRRRRQALYTLPLTFSFDGFVIELSSGESELRVYPNPIYYPFSNETVYGQLVEDGSYILESDSRLIQLRGSGIDPGSDSDVNDVKVLVGGTGCIVISVTDTAVLAEAPDEEPEDGADVMIYQGNLYVSFGAIKYPKDGLSTTVIIVIAAVGVVAAIIVLSVVCNWWRLRSIRRQRDEATVKFFTQSNPSANEASPEEQVNVVVEEPNAGYMYMIQDGQQKVQKHFYSRGQYVHNMLFKGCKKIPQAIDESRYTALEKVNEGLLDLSKLLLDKRFVLKLVEILDEDPSVNRFQRQNFAALFLMAMINDNEVGHLIDVLEVLLRKHVENMVNSKKKKQVLNRTETVIEPLIFHWMALCMYKYMMDFVSSPLYQLVEAIRTRVDSGVVDAVHHHCQYSLNEKYLLPSDITGEDIYLQLIVNEETVKQELVKVKSCDTLLQVKQKLLNTMFTDQPFSTRPKAKQVKLEWRVNREERIILQDSNEEPRYSQTKKRIKTISEYGIHGNAMVAFVNAHREDDNTSNAYDTIKPTYHDEHAYETSILVDDEHIYEKLDEGDDVYHILDLQEDAYIEVKNKVDKSDLVRVSETKAMFSPSAQKHPLLSGVKYIFDVLDSEASTHDISVNDLKIWKNNSFAEMFCVRILTHPAFVCDIQRTPPIGVTLDVISKVFQDSWSTELFSFNENSFSHRQMFVNEIPRYRQLVSSFYRDIKSVMPCNREDVINEIQPLLDPFKALFKKSSVLENLYSLIGPHFNAVKNALYDDESFRTDGTMTKMEQVAMALSKKMQHRNM